MSLDPFNPESFKLDASFTTGAAVEEVLVQVPVGKPGKQDFFRVHPDPDYRMGPVATFQPENEIDEVYLVHGDMARLISPNVKTVTLYLTTTLFGKLKLWPIPLPGADGKHNEWHQQQLRAAEEAMTGWVRLTADMDARQYRIVKAVDNLGDPQWPVQSMQELMKIAFGNRYIVSQDHPIMKRLAGRA